MLRQEAAEAIAKLKLRKYRRKATDSNSTTCTSKHAEQDKKDSEVCAVCLDEFRNNQVRVKIYKRLSQSHKYHILH